MAKSVSWGKEFYDPLLAGSLVVFVVCVAFALACLQPPEPNPPLATKCGIVAVVAGLILFPRLFVVAKSRHKLTATKEGFVLTDYRGKHTISHDDICDVGIANRTKHRKGSSEGFQRVDNVHVDMGELGALGALGAALTAKSSASPLRSVRFAFRTPSGERVLNFSQPDPDDDDDYFGRALKRALDKLADRTLDRIRDGHALHGSGWKLDRSNLVVTDKGEEFTAPLAQITAVDSIDNAICVWVAGKSDPILRRRGTSSGMSVLYYVLPELTGAGDGKPGSTSLPRSAQAVVTSDGESIPMAEVVEGATKSAWESAETGAEAGAGRLLFTRKPDVTSKLFLVAVALVLLVLGIAMLNYGFQIGFSEQLGLVAILIGTILTPLSGLLVFQVWISEQLRYEFYSDRVARKAWRGSRSLNYHDVWSFTYVAAKMYTNGVYQGLSITLTFEPDGAPRGNELTFQATMGAEDPEIEKLRDHISKIIASEMIRRLNSGETVRWTRRLTFEPGMLVFRRDHGSKAEITFAQIRDYGCKNGVFSLDPGYGRRIEEEVSAPNFFPGYFLLELLVDPTTRLPAAELAPPVRPPEPDSPFAGFR